MSSKQDFVPNESELDVVKTFVVKQRRDRYLGFLSTAKGRSKFILGLAHFRDFDPRWVVPIVGPTDSVEGLVDELRSRGSDSMVRVLSEFDTIDGMNMPLVEVIKTIYGNGMGTIVCCAPGKLAYFEGEGANDRYIVDRRPV